MVRGGKGKAQRQRELVNSLANNPLLKDGELAKMFGVSIQTIRLDRSQLQIPELRERMKSALQSGITLRSLDNDELVGELLEIQVGQHGLSQLIIKPEMAFRKNLVARGHHLFAQANSLAVALVDAEVALTGTANVMFKQPVKVGDVVLAHATVTGQKGNKTMVQVISKVKDNVVFEGMFTVFALEEEGKQ
ncbi:transcription factor FapR [Desulforamulus ferrireducens]|uniref:Fatty acid biosynthesis transcriptional regulator n=1 Tax=Desulforamulus ferrireducens TaxID=1833852 RepID=A0A1S6IXF5_9FIRM|nr:transcription factor FapR [Desulforamulus ferrireducens]AQS59459.1 fatty acid biosynthesis transcriptional regulator [Desulforamulus ferrireducens]